MLSFLWFDSVFVNCDLAETSPVGKEKSMKKRWWDSLEIASNDCGEILKDKYGCDGFCFHYPASSKLSKLILYYYPVFWLYSLYWEMYIIASKFFSFATVAVCLTASAVPFARAAVAMADKQTLCTIQAL